jgi:hypothetical protein
MSDTWITHDAFRPGSGRFGWMISPVAEVAGESTTLANLFRNPLLTVCGGSTMSEHWQCVYHGTGSCVVTRSRSDEPHYRVFGPWSDDPDRRLRDRVACCGQLRDWLNGDGERPGWLDDCYRESPNAIGSLDGTFIYTTGPYCVVDQCWRESRQVEHLRSRRLMIDRLLEREPAPVRGGYWLHCLLLIVLIVSVMAWVLSVNMGIGPSSLFGAMTGATLAWLTWLLFVASGN